KRKRPRRRFDRKATKRVSEKRGTVLPANTVVRTLTPGRFSISDAEQDPIVVRSAIVPDALTLGFSIRPVHQIQVIAVPDIGMPAPGSRGQRDYAIIQAFIAAHNLVWEQPFEPQPRLFTNPRNREIPHARNIPHILIKPPATISSEVDKGL